MRTKELEQLIKVVKMHPLLLLERMLDEQKRLRLPAEELLILQYIWLELSAGNMTPSNTYLSEQSGIDVTKVQTLVVSLMQKQIIYVTTFNEGGKIREEYDIDVLIAFYFMHTTKPNEASNKMKEFVRRVEGEFSRKLSSIEIRLIESWIYDEKIEYTMLEDALTETVLAGAKNFKYMDKILKNWQENGKQQFNSKVDPTIQNIKNKKFSQEEKDIAAFDWISSLGESNE